MIRFANPAALYGLILLPFLSLLFWVSIRARKRAVELFIGRTLFPRLAPSFSLKKRVLKAVLFNLSFALLLIALARPQVGTRLEMVKRSGQDIVIALDTSLSMAAEDVKPNRLAVAKAGIASFIDRLQGDRIGILAFAGVPFVQCPLTLDYGAAKMFLDIIGTDLIPVPGTAIGDAIRKALTMYVAGERKYKVMILVTDGEDHGTDPVGAAKQAAEEGVVIYTVGIGSPEGSPIAIYDKTGRRTYKTDRNRQTVLSRLDEETLEKIALLTNGKYYRATPGGEEFQSIYDEISGMEKKELQSRRFAQFEDRFQYPLALALLGLLTEALMSTKKRKKQAAV